jgi:hypothetical protein
MERERERQAYGGPCGQFAHLRSVSNIFRLLFVICLLVGTTVERGLKLFIEALIARLDGLKCFLFLRYRLHLPLPPHPPFSGLVPHAPSAMGKPRVSSTMSGLESVDARS